MAGNEVSPHASAVEQKLNEHLGKKNLGFVTENAAKAYKHQLKEN
jgi:hypothetical protein